MSSKDSSKNSKDENKKLKEFIKYENGEQYFYLRCKRNHN